MSTATRLWPLHGAYMSADLSVVHLGDSGPVSLPLPCFLIQHERGLVLVDTGLRPEAWDHGPHAVYGPVHEMFPFTCPPGHRLDQQIENAGFHVEDVTHVIVSHAHLDHVGGLHLFPGAAFYMTQEEHDYARDPHPFFGALFGKDDLARAEGFRWNLLSADLDLFGDGSIQLLRTPGHTPGHLSVLVKLPSRSFLLIGDAAHTMTNFQGIPCPVDLDTISAHRSIELLKDLSTTQDAEVWVMHDPEQWKRLGYVDKPYE